VLIDVPAGSGRWFTSLICCLAHADNQTAHQRRQPRHDTAGLRCNSNRLRGGQLTSAVRVCLNLRSVWLI
jgi:hypothetical protein